MHTLPELPFALDALAPLMSAETLHFHHGKHHRSYVKKLNELVKDTPLADASLEEVVTGSTGSLFDNAAQHYNHSLFWRCLKPAGEGGPGGALLEAIAARWGSFALFRDDFTRRATELFGSGWCWLAAAPDGSLDVMPLGNAGCPITTGARPILVVDVWEHAYYIDHRNSRKKYLEAFWKLASWDAAERRYRELAGSATDALTTM